MDELIEKNIENYPKAVSLKKTEIIMEQMKKKVCNVCVGDGVKGTGFFCKIPSFDNKLLPVLITNNHIINESILNKKKKISLTINNLDKTIILDNRETYTDKKYDITIIQIKEEDGINDYLEIDENINHKSELTYEGESIYLLHYPQSEEIFVSYGIIKNVEKKIIYNFNHLCSTDRGSSGGPILNLSNNKIIGIHKATVKNDNYNIGLFL